MRIFKNVKIISVFALCFFSWKSSYSANSYWDLLGITLGKGQWVVPTDPEGGMWRDFPQNIEVLARDLGKKEIQRLEEEAKKTAKEGEGEGKSVAKRFCELYRKQFKEFQTEVDYAMHYTCQQLRALRSLLYVLRNCYDAFGQNKAAFSQWVCEQKPSFFRLGERAKENPYAFDSYFLTGVLRSFTERPLYDYSNFTWEQAISLSYLEKIGVPIERAAEVYVRDRQPMVDFTQALTMLSSEASFQKQAWEKGVLGEHNWVDFYYPALKEMKNIYPNPKDSLLDDIRRSINEASVPMTSEEASLFGWQICCNRAYDHVRYQTKIFSDQDKEMGELYRYALPFTAQFDKTIKEFIEGRLSQDDYQNLLVLGIKEKYILTGKLSKFEKIRGVAEYVKKSTFEDTERRKTAENFLQVLDFLQKLCCTKPPFSKEDRDELVRKRSFQSAEISRNVPLRIIDGILPQEVVLVGTELAALPGFLQPLAWEIFEKFSEIDCVFYDLVRYISEKPPVLMDFIQKEKEREKKEKKNSDDDIFTTNYFTWNPSQKPYVFTVDTRPQITFVQKTEETDTSKKVDPISTISTANTANTGTTSTINNPHTKSFLNSQNKENVVLLLRKDKPVIPLVDTSGKSLSSKTIKSEGADKEKSSGVLDPILVQAQYTYPQQDVQEGKGVQCANGENNGNRGESGKGSSYGLGETSEKNSLSFFSKSQNGERAQGTLKDLWDDSNKNSVIPEAEKLTQKGARGEGVSKENDNGDERVLSMSRISQVSQVSQVSQTTQIAVAKFSTSLDNNSYAQKKGGKGAQDTLLSLKPFNNLQKKWSEESAQGLFHEEDWSQTQEFLEDVNDVNDNEQSRKNKLTQSLVQEKISWQVARKGNKDADDNTNDRK